MKSIACGRLPVIQKGPGARSASCVGGDFFTRKGKAVKGICLVTSTMKNNDKGASYRNK